MDTDGVKALIILPDTKGGPLPEEPQPDCASAEGLIREYAEQALLCGVEFYYHRYAPVPRPDLREAAQTLLRERPGVSHAFYLDQEGAETANSMRDFAWELWHLDIPALPLTLPPHVLARAENESGERERAPLETLSSLPVIMYAADPERRPRYADWLAHNREALNRFPLRDEGGIPCDEAFVTAASRFFREQGFRIDTVLAGRPPQNHAMFVLHSDTYTNGERVVLLCRRDGENQRPWAGVVRRVIGFIPQVAAGFRRVMFAPEFPGEDGDSSGRLAAHIVSREYFEELMYLLN